MAVKQTGRKQYRTMQGKPIDMDLLRQRNELTPAVGNARVNARGDELGPGGKIIYSGDTRPCNNFINYAQGSSLLIHEATLGTGMEAEANMKKHTTTG